MHIMAMSIFTDFSVERGVGLTSYLWVCIVRLRSFEVYII
jgi:hypothetical protein